MLPLLTSPIFSIHVLLFIPMNMMMMSQDIYYDDDDDSMCPMTVL
jgi:hypothetical protein